MPSALAISLWITMAAITALVRWSWERLTSEASVLLDVAEEMEGSYAESDLGDWNNHVPRAQAAIASTSKPPQSPSSKVSESIRSSSNQLGRAIDMFPPPPPYTELKTPSESKDEVSAWLQRVNRAEDRPDSTKRRKSSTPVFLLHSADDDDDEDAPDAPRSPATPQRAGRSASQRLLSPLAISHGYDLHSRSAGNSRRCSWDADMESASLGYRSMPASPVA